MFCTKNNQYVIYLYLRSFTYNHKNLQIRSFPSHCEQHGNVPYRAYVFGMHLMSRIFSAHYTSNTYYHYQLLNLKHFFAGSINEEFGESVNE